MHVNIHIKNACIPGRGSVAIGQGRLSNNRASSRPNACNANENHSHSPSGAVAPKNYNMQAWPLSSGNIHINYRLTFFSQYVGQKSSNANQI
jgi:hypothetical protein